MSSDEHAVPHSEATILRSVTGVPNVRSGRFEVFYPSLADFVTDVDGDTDFDRRDGSGTSRTSRDSWAGCSYDEAIEYARYGWAEGERKVIDLAERLSDQVYKVLPSYGMELAESGGEVDVATMLAGQRECMWDWRDEGGKRPVVRLSVACSHHAGVDNQAINTAGAIVVSVIDALERTGRRVELDAQLTAKSSYESRLLVGARIRLKEPDDPLDVPALVFALAHPAMTRRFLLAMLERLKPGSRREMNVPGGYGYPGAFGRVTEDETWTSITDMAQSGDAVKAYDTAIRMLREQGVEVSE